jgi:hypothetical protein
MSAKKIIGIFFFITLISLASADLIIPSNLNINVMSGQEKTFSINATNTFNFTIVNIKFSNLTGFNFPNLSLSGRESKMINFSVLRTDPGSKTLSSTISFNYYVDIPKQIQTHYINLTDSGFSNNYLTIRRGDTVTWINKDTISREISSALFNYNIQPNQSNSYTFNQLGEVSYQDLVLFYGATIKVINETEDNLVQNPSYNKQLSINLQVSLNPTNISYSNNIQNISMKYTDSKEGLIQITNTGNETSQAVKLTATSWIRFDTNNFDISPGNTKYVVYHIEPAVFKTEDTNKTYTPQIKIKGINTPEFTNSLSIFIEYADIDADLSNPARLGDILTRFCQQNPQACTPSNSTGNGTVIITDPTLNFNLTYREFLEDRRTNRKIADTLERGFNDQKQTNDELRSGNEIAIKMANESLQLAKDNERTSLSRTRSIWFVVLFAIFATAIYYLTKLNMKYNEKKNLYTGGMRLKYGG